MAPACRANAAMHNVNAMQFGVFLATETTLGFGPGPPLDRPIPGDPGPPGEQNCFSNPSVPVGFSSILLLSKKLKAVIVRYSFTCGHRCQDPSGPDRNSLRFPKTFKRGRFQNPKVPFRCPPHSRKMLPSNFLWPCHNITKIAPNKVPFPLAPHTSKKRGGWGRKIMV